MSAFATMMTNHQIKWRKRNIPYHDFGEHNGKPYPWILPWHRWKDGLWTGATNAIDSLPEEVQWHSGVHNLKSSWVLCANLYFPFGHTLSGKALLAGFLQHVLGRSIETVDWLELEYAHQESALQPAELLGETGGKRGAGQTSPDLAVFVNDGLGLVLVEIKFVEHSFYRCSARRLDGSLERPGNPNPDRCNNVVAVVTSPDKECHQHAWGRKYWKHLAPVIRRDLLRGACPAVHAGYQLFRQHALAEGIATRGSYDFVVSCIAIDERNEALRTCLKSVGLDDVRDWGSLFHGKAAFAAFTHQQWVNWVRTHDVHGEWSDWLNYVEGRYGYTV